MTCEIVQFDLPISDLNLQPFSHKAKALPTQVTGLPHSGDSNSHIQAHEVCFPYLPASLSRETLNLNKTCDDYISTEKYGILYFQIHVAYFIQVVLIYD